MFICDMFRFNEFCNFYAVVKRKNNYKENIPYTKLFLDLMGKYYKNNIDKIEPIHSFMSTATVFFISPYKSQAINFAGLNNQIEKDTEIAEFVLHKSVMSKILHEADPEGRMHMYDTSCYIYIYDEKQYNKNRNIMVQTGEYFIWCDEIEKIFIKSLKMQDLDKYIIRDKINHPLNCCTSEANADLLNSVGEINYHKSRGMAGIKRKNAYKFKKIDATKELTYEELLDKAKMDDLINRYEAMDARLIDDGTYDTCGKFCPFLSNTNCCTLYNAQLDTYSTSLIRCTQCMLSQLPKADANTLSFGTANNLIY